MSIPLITLLTDFGSSSGYVAQMKGAILSRISDVHLIDIAHDLPAQSIPHAEVILRSVAFQMPEGSVHLVVVDPGVGTSRRAIAVQAGGHYFVGPDNGVLGFALAMSDAKVIHLDRSEFFAKTISKTFHGRDIFAPVAAELAKGTLFEKLGSPMNDALQSLLSVAKLGDKMATGEVWIADRFGNLLTNIPATWAGEDFELQIDSKKTRRVKTYGEAGSNELLSLVGSEGYLEVAIKNDSAASFLGQASGLLVEVKRP